MRNATVFLLVAKTGLQGPYLDRAIRVALRQISRHASERKRAEVDKGSADGDAHQSQKAPPDQATTQLRGHERVDEAEFQGEQEVYGLLR